MLEFQASGPHLVNYADRGQESSSKPHRSLNSVRTHGASRVRLRGGRRRAGTWGFHYSMLYRFREFELDEERGELRRKGEPVAVQPRVLDLLTHLVRNTHRVVSREELFDTLWSDAVVGEQVLTSALQKARAAVGDSSSRQWAIKTLARRGYRFVAPLEGDEESGAHSRAPQPEGDSDFVGRRCTLAALLAAAERARDGRGGVHVVVGEAGMGKSRLLDELFSRLQGRPFRIATAWCRREATPPYWPWVQILRAAARARDTRELREDLGPGAADLVPLLPELRALSSHLPEPPELDPREARFRLFGSIAEFLQKAAQRRALVLLIDDLHEADASSLKLLQLLVRELRRRPILLVATARPHVDERRTAYHETLVELRRGAEAVTSRLRGLDAEETAALLTRALGAPPSPDLCSGVVARTEGNPLFIKEIAASIRARNEAGRCDPGAARIDLPPRLRLAIQQRLAPLSEPCREILTVAAAAGREFALDVVAHASELPQEVVEERLEEARHAGIVGEMPDQPGRYRLSHALLQEALYTSRSRVCRSRLHGRIAEGLEKRFREDPDAAHAAEIAHHYLAASQPLYASKALAYSLLAAERAMSLCAYSEAVDCYDSALAALDLQRGATDDVERYEILLARGAAENASDAHPGGGRDTLFRAVEIARKLAVPEKLARAALGLRAPDRESSRADGSFVEIHEEALDAIGAASSPAQAQLLARLSAELYGSDFARGGILSARAVEIARRTGDPNALGEVLNYRLLYLAHPSTQGERAETARELLELGRASDNTVFQAYAHRWRLLTFLEKGDLPAFELEREAYARVVARERSPFSTWHLATLDTMRSLLLGRVSEAERLALAASAIVQRRPHTLAIVIFALQLTSIRRDQDRLKEMLPLIQATTDVDPHHPAFQGYKCSMSLINAEVGHMEESRRDFEYYAADDFRGLHEEATWLYSLACLSETCRIHGDVARARILYELMSPYAALHVVGGNSSYHAGSVSRYLGILATIDGRYEVAAARFGEARAAHQRLASPIWLGYGNLDEARMLRQRSQGGDAESAARLLREARALGERHQAAALVHRADALARR